MRYGKCENRVFDILNLCINQLLGYQDILKIISNDLISLDLIRWADHYGIYQLPNIEFVQELAKEIKKINPDIILEVGAGKGLISRYVSKIINKKIILTDNYSWWTDYGNMFASKYGFTKERKIGRADVIKMDYKEAIERYVPDLIIASWIPYNMSWTKDFRKYSSVNGYILIGESKGGCTGVDSDWIADWRIKDLENVEKYGICRSDYMLEKDFYFHTKTTYFERF